MNKHIKIVSLIIVFCGLIVSFLFAQQKGDSVYVQSKIWYRDNNHEIQYTNWKTFGCKTIPLLAGYKTTSNDKIDKFGGSMEAKFKATGLFYTIKHDGRSWIVDPEGHPFYNVALNGVRLGKAPSNEKAFSEKFHTKEIWINETRKLVANTGFNLAGSWSDIEAIRAFNVANPQYPLVYTTQLSLLGNFSQKKKKKLGKKDYPELACVFSPDFKDYCLEKTKDLANYKNDPNLFGHFSDNELPFQENLIKSFLDVNDAGDEAYKIATKWVANQKIDTTNITKEQKLAFSGYVAEVYYKNVSEAIKQNDPNHLYIGSRLHASAKTNDIILAAAEKYLDIISINYYGEWALVPKHINQWNKLQKPFIITEFYTK